VLVVSTKIESIVAFALLIECDTNPGKAEVWRKRYDLWADAWSFGHIPTVKPL